MCINGPRVCFESVYVDLQYDEISLCMLCRLEPLSFCHLIFQIYNIFLIYSACALIFSLCSLIYIYISGSVCLCAFCSPVVVLGLSVCYRGSLCWGCGCYGDCDACTVVCVACVYAARML